MLPHPPAELPVPAVRAALPELRRMPAPTPLPTLRLPRPGLLARLSGWLAAPAAHQVRRAGRSARPVSRRSAQIVLLRA